MQPAGRLRVTRQAIQVALATYRATQRFPSSETYGLTAQMRRAAVSIGSAIAEGCGRDRHSELRPFLQHALGSASELEFQTALAANLGFGDPATLLELAAEVVRAKKMLAKLIVALGGDRGGSPSRGLPASPTSRDSSPEPAPGSHAADG